MTDIAAKPPPFLTDPGKLAIPWSEWHRSFKTYLLAAGYENFTPERPAVILKAFLGEEANRMAHMIESTSPAGGGAVNEYYYLVQGLPTHSDVAASQRINRIQFPSLRQ